MLGLGRLARATYHFETADSLWTRGPYRHDSLAVVTTVSSVSER
ncbi:MAG: hypothetical protein ACREL3_06035 [Gemmatimonadales bacterium]